MEILTDVVIFAKWFAKIAVELSWDWGHLGNGITCDGVELIGNDIGIDEEVVVDGEIGEEYIILFLMDAIFMCIEGEIRSEDISVGLGCGFWIGLLLWAEAVVAAWVDWNVIQSGK